MSRYKIHWEKATKQLCERHRYSQYAYSVKARHLWTILEVKNKSEFKKATSGELERLCMQLSYTNNP